MEVNLDQIVASEQPIRTTWSEEEMQQLTDSIKQWGVIQAVKLRPLPGVVPCYYHGFDYYSYANGGEDCGGCFNAQSSSREYVGGYEIEDGDDWQDNPFFEIVDGHRRVEASRRAGLKTIEASIEGMDDQAALIQSLIANVQREDMNPLDIGNSLLAIKNITNYANEKIAEIVGMSRKWVDRHINIAKEDDPIKSLFVANGPLGPLNERQYRSANAIAPDQNTKESLLTKASKESLSSEKIVAIGKSLEAAGDDERAKEALLTEPYSPLMHDPEIVKERKERFANTNIPDPMYIKSKDPERTSALREQQSEWDRLPQAQMVIDYIKQWEKLLKDFKSASDIGKLSPEGKRFVVRRLSDFATRITDWQNEIEEMNNE
jgi:ParB/RepB/Spo0J family partition protein